MATSTTKYGLRRPVLGQPNWGADLQYLIDQLDQSSVGGATPVPFVATPSKPGSKIYSGINVVAMVDQNSLTSPTITFPASFSSASSYVVVATLDTSHKNLVVSVGGRSANGFTPRVDVVDSTNTTTNVSICWIAVGQ